MSSLISASVRLGPPPFAAAAAVGGVVGGVVGGGTSAAPAGVAVVALLHIRVVLHTPTTASIEHVLLDTRRFIIALFLNSKYVAVDNMRGWKVAWKP